MVTKTSRSFRFISQHPGLLFLFFLITQTSVAQQRPQFTQYMFNGLIINPAYAGVDEALSVTFVHRMQWTGIDNAPVTQALSVHSLFREKKSGIGLSLLNDKIGVHQNLNINGSYAYHLALGNASWLSMGIQAGIHNRKSDFGSLASGSGNDPLVANAALSQTSFSMGAGIYFRSKRIHAGISAPELLPENATVNDTMTVHWDRTNYLLFAKYRLYLSDKIDLEPGILLKYFPGTPFSVDINLSTVFYDAVTIGISYRKDESIDFLLRGKITPQFQFGYAFDYPVGKFAQAVSGSHEIMLNYRFRNEYHKVDSPR